MVYAFLSIWSNSDVTLFNIPRQSFHADFKTKEKREKMKNVWSNKENPRTETNLFQEQKYYWWETSFA